MNLVMGSQRFENVEVPLLWGERAILQDAEGRLSIIDLSGDEARLEILADEPAPGIEFRPRVDGIVILEDTAELYHYNPEEKLVSSMSLELPEVQITDSGTRIGTNQISGSMISGFGVGIAVSKEGMAIGAPLPPKLATLRV